MRITKFRYTDLVFFSNYPPCCWVISVGIDFLYLCSNKSTDLRFEYDSEYIYGQVHNIYYGQQYYLWERK